MTPALQAATFRSFAAGFVAFREPRRAPAGQFYLNGRTLLVLRAFEGKLVLLNFWATWCAPCVYEMPSLDSLAERFAGRDLAVVAVSIEADAFETVPVFFEKAGIRHLAAYADPAGRLAYFEDGGQPADALPLYSMPISYVIDRLGMVTGYFSGAADWMSTESLAYVDHLLSQ